MIYGSVCSGIEAATVAWHPLGWKPAFFAEIEKYPSAVLKHHYAGVPNHGDFTTIQQGDYEPIELLVGGTPCQDFSVAGLRAGMDGDRGNLTLEFLRLADRLRPRWLVWENVPGVLSSTSHRAPDPCPPPDPLDVECEGQEVVTADEYNASESHALNSLVAGLSELGYGWAMRVLDAQHFGVPQRRRRVFVVGYLGDWRRAAAVLFERHSLSGYPAPRREKGEEVAGTFTARTRSGGWDQDVDLAASGYMRPVTQTASTGEIAHCLNAGGMGRQDYETETETVIVTAPLTRNPYADNESRESLLVTHSLRGDGFDASEDGTGRGTPLVPVAIQAGCVRENPDSGPDGIGVRTDGIAYTLEARSEVQAVMTLGHTMSNGLGIYETDIANTLESVSSSNQAIAFSCKDHGADALEEVSPTLRAMGHDGSHANAGGQVAVAVQSSQSGVRIGDTHATLDSNNGSRRHNGVLLGMAVRRLTPRECERLQGFPDDYTKISETTADGPRYKALGNSMAVPCMQWIGERIAMVEAL